MKFNNNIDVVVSVCVLSQHHLSFLLDPANRRILAETVRKVTKKVACELQLLLYVHVHVVLDCLHFQVRVDFHKLWNFHDKRRHFNLLFRVKDLVKCLLHDFGRLHSSQSARDINQLISGLWCSVFLIDCILVKVVLLTIFLFLFLLDLF